MYFVSLAANGNGKNSGDNVLIASKKLVFQQTVATHDAPASSLVSVFPSVVSDVLHVRLSKSYTGQLFVFDAQGKIMFQSRLVQENSVDVSRLEKGMYIAQVQFDGKVVSKKFMVP